MLLQELDIIILRKGHTVYADIPEHFVFRNKKGSWTLTHALVIIDGEFRYLAGRYIVVKTVVEGGGQAHGPLDIYPNGHHVFCQRANDPCCEVDFYQTGCFRGMIPDLVPVGRI